ncbi:(deoxy)nucleoside triphosphate pyrophosphohydrolase [Sphingobacterium griseoflavum]|nr:(deoxy)nucleoside triphosphate pyrophosphohydrolase [Sphingobacterium griseoflavum]
MAITKVVCGIIFKGEHVLICRRKQEKSLGGYWEFPGGKVEEGESYEETLVRELDEELGLKVSIQQPFVTHIHEYAKGTIELISFICSTAQTAFELVDHDQIEWIDVSQLLDWKLAPADVPIAEALMATA